MTTKTANAKIAAAMRGQRAAKKGRLGLDAKTGATVLKPSGTGLSARQLRKLQASQTMDLQSVTEGDGTKTYADRVAELEAEGATTSDAQAVADVEVASGEVALEPELIGTIFDPSHPQYKGPKLPKGQVRITRPSKPVAAATPRTLAAGTVTYIRTITVRGGLLHGSKDCGFVKRAAESKKVQGPGDVAEALIREGLGPDDWCRFCLKA